MDEHRPVSRVDGRHSPYNYAFNSPIYFIDPDGMKPGGFANTDPVTSSGSFESYNFGDGNGSVALNNENSDAYQDFFQQAGEAMANADLSLGGGDGCCDWFKDAQEWVNENKESILGFAQGMQNVGDATAIVGYGVAIGGAAIAGVGAAPGATLAVYGNGLALLGSGIEITTRIITGDKISAGTEGAFIIGGMVIDAAVDRVLPGPTPNISKEATTILRESVNVKTIIGERMFKNSQNNKN